MFISGLEGLILSVSFEYQALHTEKNIGQFYTVPAEISNRVLSHFLTKKFQSEVQYQ